MVLLVFPGSNLTSSTAAGKMTGWSMPKDVYEGETMQNYMQSPKCLPIHASY